MLEFLLLALVVAAIAYMAGGTILEMFGSLVEHQSSKHPRSPATDNASGRSAVVIRDFAKGDDDEIRGRVRFEGEDWKAVLVAATDTAPAEGDEVTVVEVDTDRLEIRVE